MAVLNRHSLLSRRFGIARRRKASVVPLDVAGVTGRISRVTFFFCVLLLQGCGLIIDAVQLLYPVTTNELDAICLRGQIQVGMAVEPFLPFVFPAVWTDEGARVTGLDAELVRSVSDALTVHCGTPVIPMLHLVRFRDLFLLLNESQLDFFVSAVAAGVPSSTSSGFAYSTPYFFSGGISGITRRPEILQEFNARLAIDSATRLRPHLLDGFTIAVQDGTAAHLYAEARVKPGHLIVCDSLPAAFEYGEMGDAVPIDVILGAKPVLEFVVKTTRHDWRLLTREQDRPLLFTDANYAVVMAEESYALRWFVNDVIFQLGETGRLDAMRQRWLDEQYAYPRRASLEGLPFDVNKMPAHYAQGTCRETSLHSPP